MTFDPDTYWPSMGEWLAGPGAATPEHREAEALLSELIPLIGPISDVLDVGCGRGRLASLLLDVLPSATYTGVDIGPEQVEATRKVRPDGEVFQSRLQDFTPDRQWDLVIVSEVLMHVRPEEIELACQKVKSLARKWLITIDWTQPLRRGKPIAEWNWLYDYPTLFGSVEREIPTGLQTIFLVRP
jgi:SAM-dependent methyltransferase